MTNILKNYFDEIKNTRIKKEYHKNKGVLFAAV